MLILTIFVKHNFYKQKYMSNRQNEYYFHKGSMETHDQLINRSLDNTLIGKPQQLYIFRQISAFICNVNLWGNLYSKGYMYFLRSFVYQGVWNQLLSWVYFTSVCLFRPRTDRFNRFAKTMIFTATVFSIFIPLFFTLLIWPFLDKMSKIDPTYKSDDVNLLYSIYTNNYLPAVFTIFDTTCNRLKYKKSDIKYPLLIILVYFGFSAYMDLYWDFQIYLIQDFKGKAFLLI